MIPTHIRHGLRLGTTLLVAALALGSAGCQLGDPIVQFDVTVDSIEVRPPQIEDGSKLQAVFYAELGPDKCWMFGHADFTRTPDAYEVRFYGRHVVRNDCPDSPSKMAYVADIFQPINDPFRITALQPNGTKLERIVTH